ncbi:MAG TPA: serine/threonine-protein kinase [Burkholderiaceae bacterium]
MPAPQRLGKYQIRRKLGAGAMGVVYEGFDPLIERSVALKVIRQDEFDATQSAELRARLRREAQAAGRLTHPGIVSVYEYGEDDGVHGAFIAMEMVRGRELKDLLDGGNRFPPARAVGVMRTVLAALQHAHERGVVHRDIKPSNVFIQDDGQVKVADFGVARLDSSDLTLTGTMIGTPSYMSPEQLLGQPIDGRSDLFSCGVMLYEMLTGEKPFTGSVTTVMHKVLHEHPAPPSTRDGALIPLWDGVITRALAKQPADRFQSGNEFSRAIELALADMPDDDASTVVMAGKRSAPLPKPIAPLAPAAQAASPPSKAIAPRSLTPWLTAMAALVAAAGGAWWLTRDHASAPATSVAAAPPPAPSAPPPAVAPAAAPPAALTTPADTAPPAPAATPAPRSAVAAAPTAAPPPAARDASADAWQVQRSRVEAARGTLSLGQALRLLLDVSEAGERQQLAEFERLLAALPPHSALALGTRDGLLRWRFHAGAADRAAAARQALQRCGGGQDLACRVVMQGTAFRTDSFLEATRALGQVGVASVRRAALRAVAGDLPALREQVAAAQPVQLPAVAAAPSPAPSPAPKPATTPAATPAPAYGTTTAPALPTTATARAPATATAAPPSPAPTTEPAAPAPAPATTATASPRPPATDAAVSASSEWAQAQSVLRASPGPGSLSDALIVLLGAQADAEVESIRRFAAWARRLRWSSALAMGANRNGVIAYSAAAGQPRDSWAQERALELCGRSSATPCAVVFASGDVRNAELAALAARLSARPQAAVRRAFIESANRTLAQGAGF